MSHAANVETLVRNIDEYKAHLQSIRPLTPSLLAAIRKPLDIEITHTSNAIEGNTLTLRETKEVIEHGVTIGGKPMKDHLEAQDHHHALEYMYDLANQNEPLTERTIRELHSLVLKRSQADIAGRYSPAIRTVSGSATVFPHPLKVPELMEEFGRNLQLLDPTPEQAFHAHYRLTRIHPFADGNGRTARLLMNLILVRGGYQPIAIKPEDRDTYLDALEVASNEGDIKPFQILMHERLHDTMRNYVALIDETIRNEEQLNKSASNSPSKNDQLAKNSESAAYAAFLARKSGRDI